MNKIKSFFSDNKKVVLIVAFILICALAIGITVKEAYFDKSDSKQLEEQIKQEKEAKQESENEVLRDFKTGEIVDIPDEELMDVDDSVDIDPEVARRKMNLKITMAKEISAKFKDVNEFEDKLVDYLIKEDFWSDVTKAKCDNFCTLDYNKNVMMLTFTLNNPAKTDVEVTYDLDNNSYNFNYH